MAHGLPGPQIADDLDGLHEAIGALSRRRPSLTERLLVETFTAAEAEKEPVLAHHPGGRRRLSDRDRMVAMHHGDHSGSDLQRGGGLGNRTEDAPDVGRLGLTT